MRKLVFSLVLAFLCAVPLIDSGDSITGAHADEGLTVPFQNGTTGVRTQLYYSGSITVTVSGVGEAAPNEYSDPFYIFQSPFIGGVPQHPQDGGHILLINGRPAASFIPSVPLYNPSHSYTFSMVAAGGQISFAVNDTYTVDNSGAYTVTLSGGVPPTAVPTDTPIPLGFHMAAVRIDPANANGGSVPDTPAVKSAAIGQKVLLSIYVSYDSLPVDNTDFTITWLLKRDGKVVIRTNKNVTKSSGDEGIAWYRMPFTPTHSGKFKLTGTVSASGDSDNGSTSFVVAAPPVIPTPTMLPIPTSTPVPAPSFSFDSLQTVDPSGRVSQRFGRGQTLYARGVFVLTGMTGQRLVHIQQAYSYWSSSRRIWVGGHSPLQLDQSAGNGSHVFGNAYTVLRDLARDFTRIRITVDLRLGGMKRQRSVVIAVP